MSASASTGSCKSVFCATRGQCVPFFLPSFLSFFFHWRYRHAKGQNTEQSIKTKSSRNVTQEPKHWQLGQADLDVVTVPRRFGWTGPITTDKTAHSRRTGRSRTRGTAGLRLRAQGRRAGGGGGVTRRDQNVIGAGQGQEVASGRSLSQCQDDLRVHTMALSGWDHARGEHQL